MLLAALFQFVGGIIVLLISAQFLLNVSKAIASKWRLSPLFIGVVVVALGTTLPEMTVTLQSIANHDPGLAMGNVVGSNITNIGLIFGLAVLLGQPKVGTTKTPQDALLLVILSFIFLIVRSVGWSYQLQGVVLLSAVLIIVAIQYVSARHGRQHEDKLLRKIAKPDRGAAFYTHLPKGARLMALLAAVIGVGIGGKLSVGGVEDLAVLLGLTTTTMGLTLVAVATSLPELITVLIADAHDDDKLLVGTIIGSNMYNLGLFGGILSLAQQRTYLPLREQLFLIEITLLFALIILFYSSRRIPRYWGVVLVVSFIIFITQATLIDFFSV